jgi:DNA polymerase-1
VRDWDIAARCRYLATLAPWRFNPIGPGLRGWVFLRFNYSPGVSKKLFLLDGMALVYRAHFALVARPIFTSKGNNSSALFVFTNTLLDILEKQKPTHIAVAFDTAAPTARHIEYPDYKIQREAMPEDIEWALPHIRRLLDAFRIPVLILDGYEADDIIGTLVRRAEKEGFESSMVTPDKDFAQLVTDKTSVFKPGRTGEPPEILGVSEILQKWGVEKPEQVIDILGLWGDASDNIPGVPGIGEKTASKLILQFGSVENLLAHAAELKGKQRENVEANREQALLSKRLATINCSVPIAVDLESLKVQEPDAGQLKGLLIEFEFNSIGRRLFGSDFKAGRGFEARTQAPSASERAADSTAIGDDEGGPDDDEEAAPLETDESSTPATVSGGGTRASTSASLKSLADVPHDYQVVISAAARADLIRQLATKDVIGFAVASTGAEPKRASLTGVGFSVAARAGWFVPLPTDTAKASTLLKEFTPLLQNESIEKVGNDLKLILGVLKWHGVTVGGKLFDVMLAHSLVEPDHRHSMTYLAESFLGYSPASSDSAEGTQTELDLGEAQPSLVAEHTVEVADLSLQLRSILAPKLKEFGQERVFHEVESPLVPVLATMEFEGVRIDASALSQFAELLSREMATHERAIYQLAGTEFNLNSPKRLGEILFDQLKVAAAPKKTRTGQYATDEQTLLALASDHEIVRRLLEYRECSKLKSTYADALPQSIFPKTGRVHTTFHQAATATGRLNSQNPNLQNIPIRSRLGQEIRKAFVPRGDEFAILSADYSQIELRIIAALSRESSMQEALRSGADIHVATAARVFGVSLGDVTPEMRERCKMVNYGLAYGMSAFGLAQRLRIPRKEASQIIAHYFTQFPGIRNYMTETVESAKRRGYVETVTGRRRYLRDIRSANANVRSAAERNAINMPIQGTAADMIKLAMIQIQRELEKRRLKTRMILQVHDELVFDLHKSEREEVTRLVEDRMKHALELDVPIVVEVGVGNNWLEAH